MSNKTVEVISRHKGKINLHVKGEDRPIVFEDKGDVGRAMVDTDEAAVLLYVGEETKKRTGFADFWKLGDGDNAGGSGASGGNAGSGDAKVLSQETYEAVKNAKELKALLAECTDKTVIMQLISVEAQKGNDTRKSYMDALNARLDEFQESE